MVTIFRGWYVSRYSIAIPYFYANDIPQVDSSLFKIMYAGMDVHKNYLQIVVLNENGKVLSDSRVDNDLNENAEYFDRLDHNRKNTKNVMESSSQRYNIYEYLSKRHLDVRLSNPARIRAIASTKIRTNKLEVGFFSIQHTD